MPAVLDNRVDHHGQDGIKIGIGEYELTRSKYDIIETGDVYSFYKEKFSFYKINAEDELCSFQLFDFNDDGQKEIYACYKNINERYFRIQGIDVNGNLMYNELIQIEKKSNEQYQKYW